MTTYQIITDRIIESLEKGIVPWKKPWAGGEPAKNLISKKAYQGINAFLLNMANYSNPYFLTLKQANEMGGSVKAGQHGWPVVFFTLLEKESKAADGRTNKESIPMMRYYKVFNASQCAGITTPELKNKLVLDPIEQAENAILGYQDKPDIKHEGYRAFYSPKEDTITMPAKESFNAREEYYSTLFHELTHSTGNAKRLNRKESDKPASFGSEVYSKEEMVAEIGSAFLCNHAGINQEDIFKNQVSYIAGWLKRLKDDPRLIINASSLAQKSTNHILGLVK